MGRKSIGWKNLWSLTVLVFLRMKPMHPYELQSIIRITHKDDFLRLNPGSLYNSIDRLLEAGLIEIAETARAGKRPERTIYRVTPAGCAEAIKWLRELLETPAADSMWFYAALSFLPALDPAEVSEQLGKRVVHLKQEIENYRHVLRTIAPRVGRLNLIEVEYALALRIAELRWVKRIISELDSGKLSWSPEMLRKHAAHFFTNCLAMRNHEPATKECL
jgi:DNA-binding PadR family transcriptional regulator